MATFRASQNLQDWNIQTNQVHNKFQMCRLKKTKKKQAENHSQPWAPSVAICTEMYLYVYGENVCFQMHFHYPGLFLTVLFSLAYAKSLQANNVDTDIENIFIFLIHW